MKAELRKQMIARRDALPPEERARIAQAFLARILALPQYGAATSVLTTMAIGSEWDTRPLIDAARSRGKTIVLPRISAPPRHLELYAVEDFERDLVPGVWNIPEPNPQRCRKLDFSEVDFALVPALAVDRSGYRLGYGAGYFDRLLAGRGARPFCVAALPSSFVVENLPHEPHDIPVDRVIDERPGR